MGWRDGGDGAKWRGSGTLDTFTHDAWNRLVKQAVDGEGDSMPVSEYQYNALHWRVLKTAPGLGAETPQKRELIYSAAWQLLEERIDDDYGTSAGTDRIGQQFWAKANGPLVRRTPGRAAKGCRTTHG